MTIQEQIADAVEFALIEQLGGYGMAYAYYESISDGSTACMHSNVIYSKESLGLLLLDYRRAHGIYEVGDKVVYLGLDGEPFLHKVEIGTSEVHTIKIFSHDMAHSYWVHDRNFRHATDAEIEAGHRL